MVRYGALASSQTLWGRFGVFRAWKVLVLVDSACFRRRFHLAGDSIVLVAFTQERMLCFRDQIRGYRVHGDNLLLLLLRQSSIKIDNLEIMGDRCVVRSLILFVHIAHSLRRYSMSVMTVASLEFVSPVLRLLFVDSRRLSPWSGNVE